MKWEHWIAEDRSHLGEGVLECTPIEPQTDGSVNIVYGMCLITDLEGLKEQGVKLVIQVDDAYELTNPRLLWESGS